MVIQYYQSTRAAMRWKEGSDQEEEVDGYKAILISHPMRSKAITPLTQPLSPFPKILNLCVVQRAP